DVGVPEEHSGRVSVGQGANISVDAFPNETFAGKVIRVNPRVDAKSRSFNVQLEINNSDPDHFLNSGMFTRIALVTGSKPNAVIVPDKALVTVEGKRLLYVVEGSLARSRQIEVGASDDGNVEIVSGVKPGELVIVEGNWALTDGQEVTIVRTRGEGQ
ncbi:MAG TPA: efflux RND transporter periplasmic adaptor subunit, partial [bacterium]|nr:efflux RND transporter periplasmic adaptor subunit [bacterium]